MASGENMLEELSISSRVRIRLRTESRLRFYKKQSRHALGSNRDQQKVPIYISGSVHRDWIPFLRRGLAEINEACPGLHLFEAEESESEVCIQGIESEESCYTHGNIRRRPRQKVYISLFHSWKNKKGTSVHELLHALGADRAADADIFLLSEYSSGDVKDIQQIAQDPNSIMMYQEGCGSCLTEKVDKDRFSDLKAHCEMNDEMSELDKVVLNQMYRPCRTVAYNPVQSSVTGLWYCGRPVMQFHNYPALNLTDGCCGPNDGANCPACRSLKNVMVDQFVSEGRWQGSSGMIYCGRNDEAYLCGPDSGIPCPQCEINTIGIGLLVVEHTTEFHVSKCVYFYCLFPSPLCMHNCTYIHFFMIVYLIFAPSLSCSSY